MNDNEVASAYLEGLFADMDAAGLSPAQKRPPGLGVTIIEYGRAKNCSEDVAQKTLNDAVKKGILVKHLLRTGTCGSHAWVYCRPEEWIPTLP
jgi:hypothetical protein